MPSARRFDAPAPLVVAASLAAVEGLVVGCFGVLEAANLSAGRVTMGLTTTAFFAAYAAGLLLCAWHLVRGAPWARSPVILAQLIQLGLAWSFRDGATLPVAVGLAVVALVVLTGLFHPASMRALDRTEEPPPRDAA